MRFYITLIILISLMTMINTKDHDNERSKSRISITSRGIKFNIFLNPADRSVQNTTAPLCFVKAERYPLMRVRFALSNSSPRVFVSSSRAEDTNLRSLVRVYIHDLGSISHTITSLALLLTSNQGISNFALPALIITNIWGGGQLQPALR
jgi:hypothetical protein